jgi:hypothetical protein
MITHVSPSQVSLIPSGINSYNNQIEIPLEYFKPAISKVDALIRRMDGYLIKRWNIPKSDGPLFDEIRTSPPIEGECR